MRVPPVVLIFLIFPSTLVACKPKGNNTDIDIDSPTDIFNILMTAAREIIDLLKEFASTLLDIFRAIADFIQATADTMKAILKFFQMLGGDEG